ncbi:MAG: hypothetical protein RRY12_01435 [Cloacibacillus sp.]
MYGHKTTPLSEVIVLQYKFCRFGTNSAPAGWSLYITGGSEETPIDAMEILKETSAGCVCKETAVDQAGQEEK